MTREEHMCNFSKLSIFISYCKINIVYITLSFPNYVRAIYTKGRDVEVIVGPIGMWLAQFTNFRYDSRLTQLTKIIDYRDRLTLVNKNHLGNLFFIIILFYLVI